MSDLPLFQSLGPDAVADRLPSSDPAEAIKHLQSRALCHQLHYVVDGEQRGRIKEGAQPAHEAQRLCEQLGGAEPEEVLAEWLRYYHDIHLRVAPSEVYRRLHEAEERCER